MKDLRFRNSVRRVRSLLLTGGLALLLALVVSACSDDPTPTPTATAIPGATPTATSSAPPVTTGGIGTFAVRRDPPANFDMMATTIWYDLNQMGAPIWGSGNLVRPCLDDVYTVCPAIAESWSNNSDFTQWTFNIRSGVKWHDGTPLTVEDMKWWLDLLFTGYDGPGDAERAPAWYSTSMGDYNNTAITDSDTLVITLNEANPLFLSVLFTPYFTIGHARHIADPMLAAGNMEVAPLDTGMMGLGPFTFDGYEKGSMMRVRANKDYWEQDEYGRQLPYMDGMDFAIMTSADVMDAAIRTGQLDGGSPGFGYILTKPRYEAMLNDLGDDFFTVKVPSAFGAGGGSGIAWNVLKEGPWQDVRVRKAVSLWVDRQESIDGVTGGFGVVGGLLNPANPFSNPDILTWPGWNPDTKDADRAEATQLMADAGYADGFELDYNCLSTGAWADRCEFLASQLAGLNIKMNIKLMDAPAWTAAATTLEYGAIQSAGGIVSFMPEPNEPGFVAYSEATTAIVKHEDPKVATYFDRLKATSVLEERIAIWQEFERYWLTEQYYAVPIAGSLATIPYRSWVKGRIHPPEQIMAYLDFATVWLDK